MLRKAVIGPVRCSSSSSVPVPVTTFTEEEKLMKEAGTLMDVAYSEIINGPCKQTFISLLGAHK